MPFRVYGAEKYTINIIRSTPDNPPPWMGEYRFDVTISYLQYYMVIDYQVGTA